MYQQLDFTTLKSCNYNRKSSESEDKQVLSISSQKDEAERIANFYKLSKFIEVFTESKSAKKEFLRPEFMKMIEMIKKETIDSIVCWKLDRLARNMTEGGMLIDLISSGVLKAIITHDKVYYPSDNVLLMSVEFGQGKQFVKDLSVNVKRGQTKKASMGVPHGVASLGFLNDRTEEKGNRNWMVDEKRLWKIKKLFELFLTGTYSAG
ncbi:recombinase family protein, partial [Candidatus Nomurabacteria bacterium]|nr:recombinase family protein [Candidatus Nomurabacteria bacterium]